MLKIRLLGRCTLESDTTVSTYTDIKCIFRTIVNAHSGPS
jgi:hypothetical protein